MNKFDIVIIGSGPGGYVAAIRAGQLGYKTAIVEKYPSLGGTCTNVGCIPTKALLDSSEHYHQAINNFDKHGIKIEKLHFAYDQFINRKNEVVSQNINGLNYLMNKNRITVIQGEASFIDNRSVVIRKKDTDDLVLNADHFIIATGAKPASIPNVTIDKKRIISSTEALSLPKQPKDLIIIGGGVIGVEMASIFNRIKTKVTIIENSNELIPSMDLDLGKALYKILMKEGVNIELTKKVKKVESNDSIAKVFYENELGQMVEKEAEYVLIAVGRKPYTKGLGLENTDVELNEKGQIVTNDHLQTTVPNIYAIGDVIKGPMLAHKAEEEAVFVIETINGQKPHINYNRIPNVVYTWPEVASVGSTEEELKLLNIEFRVGKFPFSANSKARTAMEKEGFVKVISSTNYGEILGVHIIGPRAADLISQAVIALEYEVTDSDMYKIAYAHPTYSEVLKEAFMLAAEKRAINI